MHHNHHYNSQQERTASIMRPDMPQREHHHPRDQQQQQQRGIPLPGMVPPGGVRSLHGSPLHVNPAHGFVNPLGPGGLGHPMGPMPPGAVSVGVMAGMPLGQHSPRQGRTLIGVDG